MLLKLCDGGVWRWLTRVFSKKLAPKPTNQRRLHFGRNRNYSPSRNFAKFILPIYLGIFVQNSFYHSTSEILRKIRSTHSTSEISGKIHSTRSTSRDAD